MRKLRPALQSLCLVAIFVAIPTSVIQAEPVLFAQTEAPTATAQPIATGIAAPRIDTPVPTLTALGTEQPTPSVSPVAEIAVDTAADPIQVSVGTWEPVPYDTCMKLALPPCLNLETTQLPPAPKGFTWKRLDGTYTFSAYAHPSEDYFMGDQMDIPGIPNLTAKEDFLYGVYGIGMQGGGYVWRKNAENQLAPVYIRYIDGNWKLGGDDVVISDQWRYEDSGKAVDPQAIGKIRLNNAKFAMDAEPDLTPYYSVAASPRFPLGTRLYVPGLSQFGGAFEVQDRGGAFGPDSQRFDLYVGKEMDAALQFIRLGAARSNLTVFALEPE